MHFVSRYQGPGGCQSGAVIEDFGLLDQKIARFQLTHHQRLDLAGHIFLAGHIQQQLAVFIQTVVDALQQLQLFFLRFKVTKGSMHAQHQVKAALGTELPHVRLFNLHGQALGFAPVLQFLQQMGAGVHCRHLKTPGCQGQRMAAGATGQVQYLSTDNPTQAQQIRDLLFRCQKIRVREHTIMKMTPEIFIKKPFVRALLVHDRGFGWLMFLGILFGLQGCSTVAYIGHTAKGQWQLMQAREPIAELITDNNTPPELRSQLQQVLAIREFATNELKLPDNDSYRQLSVTGREAVTWTVSAAPALSVEPIEWCFPIAGCVPYRGYFAEDKAQRFARQQHRRGRDVAVVPVLAYSTLGWFDDPLTDTMLNYGELALANLIFHELAHQQVYVPGDSRFNESYATWIGREGVRRWAMRHGERADAAFMAWQQQIDDRSQFNQLAMRIRTDLQQLYASSKPDPQKLAEKDRLLSELEDRLADQGRLRLGLSCEDDAGFRHLNNAHLALLVTYTDYLCAFDTLWSRSGADFETFHQRVAELGEQAPAQRSDLLNQACQR